MQVTVHNAIDEITPAGWNRLRGTESPFLRHEFLRLGEQHGCVSAEQGWQPRHLGIYDEGELRAAMPLYEKSHSWGEFVFDWAWANAYEQHGLSYYPKLVSASPFTPAPGRRLLLADADDTDAASGLLQAARTLAVESGCSSLHIQFPLEEELPHFEQAGMMLRKDCQFHWHNRGYKTFDDFLATFTSRKRKKVNRERRRMREHGIAFRHLHGTEMTKDLWSAVYHLVGRTFMLRGAMPYYNESFFHGLGIELPDKLLIVLAEQDAEPVAAAVFYVGDDRLYGRYWGSNSRFDSLHFETCYYQGIDYCIAHDLDVFEPGTQGEHKISRGFVPVTTWSAHWLHDTRFADAIGRYLGEEGRQVDRYIDAVDSHSPYRESADDE